MHRPTRDIISNQEVKFPSFLLLRDFSQMFVLLKNFSNASSLLYSVYHVIYNKIGIEKVRK